MALRLFNTLTRTLEDFASIEEGHVRMYTCGPTVYERPHIGNFRTFLFDDILRRYLAWKGYQVTHVRNITDVDDNTIREAVKAGTSLHDLTEPFIAAFFEDLERLGLKPAEQYPRATDYIPQMIELVERLHTRQLAYEADGSVYFDISKFPEYGRLAQLDKSEIRAGMRVSSDEAYEKQDARDFVLWKGGERPEEGDVAVWDSPWGPGRPGWHLECSVMATTLLGETIDIHTGGVDLIFPHHTNEIAQSEGACGCPFARYWLHASHLLVNNAKMSKSAGNFYTIQDLIDQGYPPSVIRRLLVSAHYRTELNFTLEGLEDAGRSVERLMELRRRLEAAPGQASDLPATRLPELARAALESFEEAMDDDLNVAEGWGALFVFVRDANAELDRAAGVAAEADVAAALEAVKSMDSVFGVLDLAEREVDEVPDELRGWIEDRLAARARARENGDYARADSIREELVGAGIEIEDTPGGSRWKRAKPA